MAVIDNVYTYGTPEYEEAKEKLRKQDNIRYAKDPIFAPITYGDDRQVCRTRRGILCQIEKNYNPGLVYCKCLGCNYQWTMDKQKYVQGTGEIGNRPNPTLTKNVGQGGTGLIIGNFPMLNENNEYELKYKDLPRDLTKYYDYDAVDGRYWGESYSHYNVLAHDTSCCKECIIKCENGLMHTHDFYPLTGGTGESGELIPEVIHDLEYDENDGHLKGDLNSHALGGIIPIYSQCSGDRKYTNHPGGSGTYGGPSITNPDTGQTIPIPAPRTFGGHPMACPNCCRVNFIAKWFEPNDRPYPYGDYEHVKPEDIESDPIKTPQFDDYYNEYLPWVYQNKFLAKFDFEASTNWFVANPVFKTHVALLVFNYDGRVIKEENIYKIQINHISGDCRITWNAHTMAGYIWVLRPSTILQGYVPLATDNLCTGIIVRDFQRIKSHFTEIF